MVSTFTAVDGDRVRANRRRQHTSAHRDVLVTTLRARARSLAPALVCCQCPVRCFKFNNNVCVHT